MSTVDATTFRRDFGRYQHEAHDGVITVTSHGRVVGAFLSARDFEDYERLKRRERQVFTAGSLPDDLVAAIQSAEYLKSAE